MEPYRDFDRDSGIAAFDYGPDWIHVQFKAVSVYEYTYSRPLDREILMK